MIYKPTMKLTVSGPLYTVARQVDLIASKNILLPSGPFLIDKVTYIYRGKASLAF